MDTFVHIRLGILLLVILGGCWVAFDFNQLSVSQTSPYLMVRFLDVGQGDAIHIQTPDGYEMLVDGGATAGVLREFAHQRSFFDRTIDVVVATHFDADHIGGLVDILGRYDVARIMYPKSTHDSPVAQSFADAVKNESAQLLDAQAGQIITLGASTTVKVFSPTGDSTNWPSNTASVVVQVSYGDIDFLLTGDAPAGVEEFLVTEFGESLESEVLKLGHHGSKTSTSELFLDTVRPQYAVVSAGLENRYGHPHQDVMQRVFTREVRSFHTGVDGTVVFYTDGEKLWLE